MGFNFRIWFLMLITAGSEEAQQKLGSCRLLKQPKNSPTDLALID